MREEHWIDKIVKYVFFAGFSCLLMTIVIAANFAPRFRPWEKSYDWTPDYNFSCCDKTSLVCYPQTTDAPCYNGEWNYKFGYVHDNNANANESARTNGLPYHTIICCDASGLQCFTDGKHCVYKYAFRSFDKK